MLMTTLAWANKSAEPQTCSVFLVVSTSVSQAWLRVMNCMQLSFQACDIKYCCRKFGWHNHLHLGSCCIACSVQGRVCQVCNQLTQSAIKRRQLVWLDTRSETGWADRKNTRWQTRSLGPFIGEHLIYTCICTQKAGRLYSAMLVSALF